ncbi:MAG: rod shape-determining protein MreC [Planctomycetota bacterium]
MVRAAARFGSPPEPRGRGLLPAAAGRPGHPSWARRAAFIVALGIFLLCLRPSPPVSFVMATAGYLHLPGRWLVGALTPESVPSLEPPDPNRLLEAVRAYYAGALPARSPAPGQRFLTAAVLERADRAGLLFLDGACGPAQPGDAVFFREVLLGFVAGRLRGRLVVETIRRTEVVLRVEIPLPDGGRVRALAEGDPARPHVMLLRHPERYGPLQSGLPVVTEAMAQLLLPPLVPGGERWCTRVAEGHLVGRLVADATSASGTGAPYAIAIPEGVLAESRLAVESAVVEPDSGLYPRLLGAGFEVLDLWSGGALPTPGAGLDVGAGWERGVAKGQAVSRGPFFAGLVEHVGFMSARARRPIDGSLRLAALAVGRASVQGFVVELLPWTGEFRILGPGPALRPGDWIVTSGGDPEVPAGLVVGRVESIPAQGTSGRLELARGAGEELFESGLVIWKRRGGAEE